MKSISDKIFSAYGDLANKNGISSMTEPARTLMAVYITQGIIGNGGFAYFLEYDFEGDDSCEVITNSYRSIGLEEYAKAIEIFLALFPDNNPHKNRKERDEFIYKYMSGDDEENHSEIVEKAERLFFKDVDSVYKLADQYVIKNVKRGHTFGSVPRSTLAAASNDGRHCVYI